MNKFINKILREAEDSSDDFFQSKHVNKRKESFEMLKKETISSLAKGLREIRIAYRNDNWSDDKEELFLKLFSKLHVSKNFYDKSYVKGYYLTDDHNNKICFYDLINSRLIISNSLVWGPFQKQFHMSYVESQPFVEKMLKKYFKLNNITAWNSLDATILKFK